MEISIMTLRGETHTLAVQPQSTVASLKALIQAAEGTPGSRQKLVLQNGQRTALTEDSRTLSSYGLQSGSRLALLVTEPVTIQVFVKKDADSKPYDIKPNETVSNFKQRVHHRESVPIDQFRLSYGGKDLMDGHKLSDYNITAGSTIYMCFRLRGG